MGTTRTSSSCTSLQEMDQCIKSFIRYGVLSVWMMDPEREEPGLVHDPLTPTVQNTWNMCGQYISRSAVVFLCQVIILYISIVTCFVNLTIRNGPNELWISLLSICLGSILPSPKVKKPWSKSNAFNSHNSIV